MNELPSVALVTVLDCLPYQDLVRYRLVNKLWRHLIDFSVSKNELALFIEANPTSNWWKHSGKAISLENSIQANYSVFKSESFFALFKSVKSLFLSFNLFFFNQDLADNLARHFDFTLENLQIDYQSTCSLEASRHFKLSLKNLKTFCFSKQMRLLGGPQAFGFSLVSCDRLTHLYANRDIKFEKNSLFAKVAPNLRALFANRITYEESLRFPKLERLGCFNAPGSKFLTFNLPNLKEFYFATDFPLDLAVARHSIWNFLDRIQMERRKVDVFWQGLKFTLENLHRNLNALNFQSDKFGPGIEFKTLDYYKENSSILNFDYLRYTGNLVFCTRSFPDQTDQIINRELINNLRKNLKAVEVLELKELNVPKKFNLFQSVSKLIVRNILKQTELDKLPSIFPSLRVLYCESLSAEDIDLSFLLQFKNLLIFGIVGSSISLTLLNQMLLSCQYLHFIVFGRELPDVAIRIGYKYIKLPEQRFNLKFLISGESLNFKKKDELLEYLEINSLAHK